MPSVAPLPPDVLRQVLERHGWKIVDETENAWLMADERLPKPMPISIPKHGDDVSPEVMDSLVHHHSPVISKAIMDAISKHLAGSP